MALIEIHDVPDDLHRRLTERAAREGMTLSDLVLAEPRRSMDHPTRRELLDRLASLPPREYRGETAAESTRAERDAG